MAVFLKGSCVIIGNQFQSVKTSTLLRVCSSGGNKRKLSTAVALVGDPPIVFLVGIAHTAWHLVISESVLSLVRAKPQHDVLGRYLLLVCSNVCLFCFVLFREVSNPLSLLSGCLFSDLHFCHLLVLLS